MAGKGLESWKLHGWRWVTKVREGEMFCALKTHCFAIQMLSGNRTANSFNALKEKICL